MRQFQFVTIIQMLHVAKKTLNIKMKKKLQTCKTAQIRLPFIVASMAWLQNKYLYELCFQ